MKKVLVVDDEPALRMIVHDILHEEGYRVILAAHGRAMVELAARERPDLVLMDVMMPEGDGRDAYRELRARPDLSGVPVVMMSAAVHPSGLDPSISGFVRKPFDLAHLLNVVGNLIGPGDVNVAS